MTDHKENPAPKEFEEKLLELKRVSKKTKGGNNITFTALVVVGNRNGKVGLAMGRGLEVGQAVKKAALAAKKKMIDVRLVKNTLPHDIKVKFKAARLILKPAPQGVGLKVGSVVRSILEVAGVQNASGKILGSRNHNTNAHVVMKALSQILIRS